MTAGFYQCAFNATASAMTCKQTKGLVGGAHESFWAFFGDKLYRLSADIAAGPLDRRDAQDVIVQIDGLRTLIRPQRSHTWLSVVRNEVQYRYQYGVWFPAEHKKAQRAALARLAAQWTRDPMKLNLSASAADLDSFVAASAFIIAACRAMLIRISERSTARSRAFVNFGPMSLLRHMGVS